jgi:hypothetical protein
VAAGICLRQVWRCPLRAEKPILRLPRNDGYSADCGRSQGGPRRGAIRPIEASKGAVGYVRCAQRPAIHRRLRERVKSTLSCPMIPALRRGGKRKSGPFADGSANVSSRPFAALQDEPCERTVSARKRSLARSDRSRTSYERVRSTQSGFSALSSFDGIA